MAKFKCTNCPSNCKVTLNLDIQKEETIVPYQCIYNWDNDCDVEWVKVEEQESIVWVDPRERLNESIDQLQDIIEEIKNEQTK